MKYIFVTGMGRSGTKFLGHLLRGQPGIEAHHECLGSREFSVLSYYLDADSYAVPYLEREKRAVEERLEDEVAFVDVNSYLRNSVPALRRVFAGCAVFHLIRDPRAVIPSIYTRRDEGNVHIVPLETRGIQWWLEADKFEQVCWNWADTTKRLIAQGTILLQFEKMVSSYLYFREQFLSPCNLHLTEETWRSAKDVRVNRTRSRLYRYLYAKIKNKTFVQEQMPPYDDWTDRQKEVFDRICGDVRREVGYA